MKANIALIPGLIGEEMDRDLFGTFEKLVRLGYKGIEGSAVLRGDVAANRAKRQELGLAAVSIGTKREALRGEPEQVIAEARAAGAEHVIVWHGPCDSEGQLREHARLYDEAGEKLAAAGLKLCYHNHDHEFRTHFGGRSGLEVLLSATDPERVHFELDVGWVLYGGEDPVAVLRRHAARIPLVHLKDVATLERRGVFTAVGTGLLDVRAVVETGLETGVKWFVVEQDRPRNLTGMESVAASILNLREMGLA